MNSFLQTTKNRAVQFLLSIKTAIWLLCLLIILLFAGSFIMPGREEFQSIHSLPLLKWIVEQSLGISWWLWGSIGLLCLLAANTIFCSVEALVKRRKVSQWMLIISPQIIHIGFLFMLVAHFMSSAGGFKYLDVAGEGSNIKMPGGEVLFIKGINISADPQGYISYWTVDAEYRVGGRTVEADRLMPNKPSFRGGIGVYVKDIRAFPSRLILIEISREPGAIWALAGGILFMAGSIALLILKMRRDYPLPL